MGLSQETCSSLEDCKGSASTKNNIAMESHKVLVKHRTTWAMASIAIYVICKYMYIYIHYIKSPKGIRSGHSIHVGNKNVKNPNKPTNWRLEKDFSPITYPLVICDSLLTWKWPSRNSWFTLIFYMVDLSVVFCERLPGRVLIFWLSKCLRSQSLGSQ